MLSFIYVLRLSGCSDFLKKLKIQLPRDNWFLNFSLYSLVWYILQRLSLSLLEIIDISTPNITLRSIPPTLLQPQSTEADGVLHSKALVPTQSRYSSPSISCSWKNWQTLTLSINPLYALSCSSDIVRFRSSMNPVGITFSSPCGS
jgi:hypothetical protein